MYNKNIVLLHLICLLGAIGIYYIGSLFIQANSIVAFSSVIIFHLACYQITELFNLSQQIVKNDVEKDFERNREKYKKEFEQVKRQSKFFEAFETPEEKEIKEKNASELEEFHNKYAQAKVSYMDKNVKEMNPYEKAYYYERKLKLFRKVLSSLTVIFLFFVGFLTLFGEIIGFTNVILTCLILLILFLVLWPVEGKLRNQYTKYYEEIQPSIFDKFLRDMGIK